MQHILAVSRVLLPLDSREDVANLHISAMPDWQEDTCNDDTMHKHTRSAGTGAPRAS
jgi:hypothetical protein